MPQQLLKIPDLCRLLQFKKSTVYNMVRTGSLTPMPGFKSLRFSPVEVEKILHSGLTTDHSVIQFRHKPSNNKNRVAAWEKQPD
jgi:predicted DNA-binding transcriptional regulator AlpA